jgi:hypothetical protein
LNDELPEKGETIAYSRLPGGLQIINQPATKKEQGATVSMDFLKKILQISPSVPK